MRPLVYSVKKFEQNKYDEEWQRSSTNVTYLKNNIVKEGSNNSYYTLSF